MSTEADGPQTHEIADLLLRVYEIHQVMIEETGGAPGLRDAGLLYAAVARPFATYAGQELYPTPLEKASALFHSLIKNHPFVYGVKRTAFAAALYLLDRHGAPLPVVLPHQQVVAFTLAVAEGGHPEPTIAEIAAWLRHVLRLEGWEG